MRDGTYERAHRALRNGFHRVRGAIEVDAGGTAARLDDVLIDGVARDSFEADFAASHGPEFEGELRRLQAPSTLAVNCFGPWRREAEKLVLAGETGFSQIGFGRSLATGLAGPATLLDLVAESPAVAIGVEIKLLEYLRPPEAGDAESCRQAVAQALREISDRRTASRWFEQLRLAQDRPDAYQALFVAQLLGHYIALTHCFPDRRKVLLYLYWEPTNWRDFAAFKRHRDEVDRFAAAVEGDEVAFRAQSFPEMWAGWAKAAEPAWLRAHARRLLARYELPM